MMEWLVIIAAIIVVGSLLYSMKDFLRHTH